MTLRLYSILLAAILLLTGRPLLALPSLEVDVRPRHGTLSDVFVLSITVHNGSATSPPPLSSTDDFEINYFGPQTSVQIVNGEVRRQVTYVYRLTAKREGTLATPPIRLRAGPNVELEGAPLEVKVSSSPPPASARVAGVTVGQQVDKDSVYLGEQIINTLEIGTSTGLSDPAFEDLTYEGFRHVDLGKEERGTRVVRGRPQSVIRLRKALFPLRPGELVIPARTLKGRVRDRSTQSRLPFSLPDGFDSNLFDELFGGGRLQEIRVTSAEIPVTVRPLPPRPADLPADPGGTPIVGHTGIKLNLSTATLTAGEAVTVVVEVTSLGNLAGLRHLPWPERPDFKVYEEMPEEKNFDSGETLVSRKTLRLSVVPIRGGTISLPPVEIPWFNPETGTWQLARQELGTLTVSGGSAEAVASPPPESTPAPGSSPTAAPAPALTYEEPGLATRLAEQLSPSLVLLLVTALGAITGVIALALYLFRRGEPERMLLRRLEVAGDAGTIYGVLIDALRLRAGVRVETLSEAGLRAILAREIRQPELLLALQRLLDDLDQARFGGGGAPDIAGLRNQLREIVAALPPRPPT